MKKTKTAVVVDPQRDIDQYLTEAETCECKIRFVFLTHFHADFLAGHLELRNRMGAQICLGAQAKAEFPYRAFSDGDSLKLGKVVLRVLETPGHTPEGISILVYDQTVSADTPHAVLTGDTLFIGDVGRPDLMASVGVKADELARQLYDSLHSKLLRLPGGTLVYPAHGAGSMCGKHLSSETVSTIQAQRVENYALQPMTKDAFVNLVTKDQPEAPQYFRYDALLNRKERQTLEEVVRKEWNPLSVEDVLLLQQEEVQIVDVRDPADFARGHLHGSINIGLGGKFATWAGIVLSRGLPIILIAEPGREEEAIRRLGRIGFDHVAGYLDGGMQSLVSRPDCVTFTDRVTIGYLGERLKTNNPTSIIDVRTEREWEAGHIEGSLNIPLPHLMERMGEVPKDGLVVVHCASGYRSSIAASLLERDGMTNVSDLMGGYEAWEHVWGGPERSSQSLCAVNAIC